MQEQVSKNITSRCSPAILRMTWAEKEEICKEWQLSGLNKQRFCAQKNINVSTFAGWCCRLWPETRNAQGGLLLPVNLPNLNSGGLIAEPIILEVSFPNKIVAKVQATVGQFSYLLKEIIDATAVIR